jgi:ankyrin repeat protein
MTCVMANEKDLTGRLIKRGADINFTNKDGQTALSCALIYKKLEMVQFLLNMGANPHIADLKNNDSCDYAL